MIENSQQKMQNRIDAHWDWLAPIIARVPLEIRDDAFIEYIFKTSGLHFAKHQKDADKELNRGRTGMTKKKEGDVQ